MANTNHMLAGEHRYEDSYFMKHNRDNAKDDVNKQQAKRARTSVSPQTTTKEETGSQTANSSVGGKTSKFQCIIQ